MASCRLDAGKSGGRARLFIMSDAIRPRCLGRRAYLMKPVKMVTRRDGRHLIKPVPGPSSRHTHDATGRAVVKRNLFLGDAL